MARVFHAVAQASTTSLGGVPLGEIGAVTGLGERTPEDFGSRNRAAAALMTAMYDLAAIGLIGFKNVDHGNRLTPAGRDVAESGLRAVWPEIAELPVSEAERTSSRGSTRRPR